MPVSTAVSYVMDIKKAKIAYVTTLLAELMNPKISLLLPSKLIKS